MSIVQRIIVPCLVAASGLLIAAVPAIAAPAVFAMPGSVEFAASDVHGPAAPGQQVTFFDGSGSATSVKGLAITGPDAADFSLPGDGCTGQVLEPAASCSVEVGFHPVGAGARSATLQMSESTGTVEVALSGSGVTGVLLAPATLSLPMTIIGQNQTEQVTVTDQSAATLVESVEITGPDASSFEIAYGNCQGSTLQPGNTCGLGIRFAPQSPGVKSAQLVLNNDSPEGPVVIDFAGTGAAGPRLSIDSRQALLGEVTVGSSASHTFTLTNTGDYPMGLQSFLVSGTPLMFPITADSCTRRELAPGASCAITVAFAPTTTGTKDASVILVNESAGGIMSIGLEGIGVAPAPSVGAPPSTPTGGAPVLSTFPRLLALAPLTGARAVQTHVRAVCPHGLSRCTVRSTLTARLSARAAGRAHLSTRGGVVSLGSSVFSLAGGSSAAVSTHLSAAGARLLRHLGRLRVSVTIEISAPGVPAVVRSRRLTLTYSSPDRPRPPVVSSLR